MKASDLIITLESMMAKYGDLEVFSGGGYYDLEFNPSRDVKYVEEKRFVGGKFEAHHFQIEAD